MQTPEDILLESIQIASLEGDSAALRKDACARLAESLKLYYNVIYAKDTGNGHEGA